MLRDAPQQKLYLQELTAENPSKHVHAEIEVENSPLKDADVVEEQLKYILN